MSNTKSEQSSIAQAEQPRHSQSSSSPRHQSSSPQPCSPTSITKPTPPSAEDTTSRRKREREGSLEPSQLTPSKATEAIPAKKNRLEDSLPEEDDDDASSHPAETDKVGQIRKKVDELSTKELELKSAAKPSDAVVESKQDAVSEAISEPAPSTESKPQSAASATQHKSAEPQAAKSSQDPPARTQPTFSSFSSKSSPFSSVPSSSGSSSAAATKTGFAAFAAKSSGIKPSSLGSSIGGHHENGSVSPLAGTPA
ncbi:hypothetical protein, partial [Sporisorium scitamineum]